MARSTKAPPTSCSPQIGFIQGPAESFEDFAKRIAYCSSCKDPYADDHLLGWIPLYYTNKGLSFFEGGATFIEEKEGIVRPIIHLRKAFKKKNSWLFYDKKEIVEHELVHAMRCTFDEPKIEEYIAYQTSKVAYRKYFGPLFTSPKEIFLFFGLLSMPLVFSQVWLFALPLCSLGGLLVRLVLRQKKFQLLLKKYPSFEQRMKLQDLHFHFKTD